MTATDPISQPAVQPAATGAETDFAIARKAMIDSQLRTSGVNETFVMAAMGSTAREDYVPAVSRSVAYTDRAVPLGEGRFLPAPLFHGRALAECRPSKNDRALVVDSGAGYLPALLAPLVESLDVITPDEATAKSRKTGNYTLLVVDGAIEEFPDSLAKRLADDARVVTGLAENRVTRLAVGRKSGSGKSGKVSFLRLSEMGIPQLHAFDRAEGWSF